MFSCEFCEISKSTCFTEHLWATASAKTKNEDFAPSKSWDLGWDNGKSCKDRIKYCVGLALHTKKKQLLEVFYKKTVFLKFGNIHRLLHRRFPVNIAKFSRAPILESICEWLLLMTETFSVRKFESDKLALEFRNTELLLFNYKPLLPNGVFFLDLMKFTLNIEHIKKTFFFHFIQKQPRMWHVKEGVFKNFANFRPSGLQHY